MRRLALFTTTLGLAITISGVALATDNAVFSCSIPKACAKANSIAYTYGTPQRGLTDITFVCFSKLPGNVGLKGDAFTGEIPTPTGQLPAHVNLHQGGNDSPTCTRAFAEGH